MGRDLENLRRWKQENAWKYKEHHSEYNRKRYWEKKAEISEKAKTRYIATRDDLRWKNLRAYYGISKEQYNELLATQNFSCAICTRRAEDLSKHLFVDHDHKTGEIRGLLCVSCNFGLGAFRDDKTNLHAAIEYLDSGAPHG